MESSFCWGCVITLLFRGYTLLWVFHNPQGRVALARSCLQPIGWHWSHPMGTEHREWGGENNEYEYPYDLSSKQNKKLQGDVTHPKR